MDTFYPSIVIEQLKEIEKRLDDVESRLDNLAYHTITHSECVDLIIGEIDNLTFTTTID
jgi:tetrahydromethanopterin S-methyltransferase subunit G